MARPLKRRSRCLRTWSRARPWGPVREQHRPAHQQVEP